MERTNVWNTYDLEMQRACLAFAEEYRQFLSDNKTERECVDTFVNLAEDAGYVELSRAMEEARRTGRRLQPGDKIYMTWMDKSMVLFRLGTRPLEEGLNILGAHIDSPRMDVKQNPVYEKGGLAYLDTHYYGGIKKYQFVARPLALHGVVVKKNGETVILNVGEDPDDPVFFISDILIHLAQTQMNKKASEAVPGEALDLIVGNRPITIDANTKRTLPGAADGENTTLPAGCCGDEPVLPTGNCTAADGCGAAQDGSAADGQPGCCVTEDDTAAEGQDGCRNEERENTAEKEAADRTAKEAVKSVLLQILEEQYGIREDDFESAELEIVPAGPARDAGFDRSMILGYGHDDRVCAYPSFRAIVDTEFGGEADAPERTSVCLLVDKEEIGSVGATGMQSRYFENAAAEIMNLCGQYSELALRRCLANSCMLSSDVSSAYDPNWSECFDEKNTAYLGRGLVLNKFTGSRGKSGSNDANAEYIAHLRGIFSRNGVVTQTAELGKVDVGGGGTIAYILALYGMNVIDSGVPVLSMHSPAEAVSKADVYEAYRGYQAFLKEASLRSS